MSRKLPPRNFIKLAADIFNQTANGIFITDNNRNIICVNPAFERITSYSENEVLGRNPRILKSGRHNSIFYKSIWDSLHEHSFWEGEIWNLRKDGKQFPVWQTIISIKSTHGHPNYYVSIFSDITTIEQSCEVLAFKASHDSLTGLPNRLLFVDRLKHLINRASRQQCEAGVLYIDVDGFKKINDHFGHATGDMILQEVAQRLLSCVRQGDTVARLGGDEFAILIELKTKNPCNLDRICQSIVSSFKTPYQLKGCIIHVSVSIGISRFPNDTVEPMELLNFADQAMYASKVAGKGQYTFFHCLPYKIDSREATSKTNLIDFSYDDFRISYRPVWFILDHALYGIEASIDSESIGIKKSECIQNSNKKNGGELSLRFENALLERVIKDLKKQKNIQQLPYKIIVPVSYEYIRQENIEQTLRKLIGFSKHVAGKLLIEICEASLIKNADHTESQLKGILSLGIQIGVREFGKDITSIRALSSIPITHCHLYQSKHQIHEHDAESYRTICCLIALAKSMSSLVIANNINCCEELSAFRELGVELGSGDAFGIGFSESALGSQHKEQKK
ncbi:diguanylate cyclase domain-containing protein [Undibacterium danionis]|uniref:Diguanylate cyclase domain-containing protein n=1 Tax=Undibacterium danionis TaxID=1812100 RepID=A0ABV6IIV9_9BURK